MDQELEDICSVLLQRPEYQRKEVISILIASMLTEMSDKEAKKTYDKLKDNRYKGRVNCSA